MSTAPPCEPHYSVADYLQWEGDWELWSGTAVAMSPSPLGPHERAAAKLVFQIESCLQAQGCSCATYAGLDWIVSDDTVVRPDVMVVCGIQAGRHLERPPALAIEILGDATAEKDRTAKRSLYALAGVGHYILVDPIAKTIEWLDLGLNESTKGNTTSTHATYTDRSGEIAHAQRFSLTLADGCRIDLDRQITFA